MWVNKEEPKSLERPVWQVSSDVFSKRRKTCTSLDHTPGVDAEGAAGAEAFKRWGHRRAFTSSSSDFLTRQFRTGHLSRCARWARGAGEGRHVRGLYMMSVDGLSPRAGGRQLPATSRARGRAVNRGLARGEGTGGTLWLRGSATPSSEQLRASESLDGPRRDSGRRRAAHRLRDWGGRRARPRRTHPPPCATRGAGRVCFVRSISQPPRVASAAPGAVGISVGRPHEGNSPRSRDLSAEEAKRRVQGFSS